MTITLRNLPPDLQKVVRKRARETGASLNKTVIGMLEVAAGIHTPAKKRKVYTDLDHLFGSWSKEEADAFDKVLAEQRKIDPELWK